MSVTGLAAGICRSIVAGCLSMVLAMSWPVEGQERVRVMVETDAGGDPDDEQSLVRFLLYANEWEVEGIIANRPRARPGENLNEARTGLGIVQRQLTAYGEVLPRLRENAAGYPSKEELWGRTVSGSAASDAGVNLIIAAVDRDDPRPVWFQNWGTDHGSDPSNLKRALDKVLAERGQTGYAKFKDRIRLSSDDQFGEHTTKLLPPWRIWVNPSRPKMEGAFMYHRFGPLTAEAGGFDLARDVLHGHGPLGALYPTNTNIRQKEGDSGYFIYLIPTGMNDPMQPGWGSWAGRFGEREDQQPPKPGWVWANVRDHWQGTTNRDNVLKRWAVDLQNDFRARMDWCVKPFAEANHAPVAALNGDRTRQILKVGARAGATLELDAHGARDPDGDSLSYEWFYYREAGTYEGEIEVRKADEAKAEVRLPAEAAGKTVHIILAVRDDGNPPLAGYRRIIFEVGTN